MARRMATEIRASEVTISRKAYIFGNMFPDFLPHVPRHNQESSRRFFNHLCKSVSGRTRKNASKIHMWDSFLLGMISHYAADYTCTAHQSTYTENMRKHVRYERDMAAFLKRNPTVLHQSYQVIVERSRSVSAQIVYRKTDNFGDELVQAMDALRLVWLSTLTVPTRA